MDSLPMISILILVFAMIILGEHMKLKKEVRRLGNLVKHLKKEIDQVTENKSDKNN